MIASFFQNLSDSGVESLLISGQASVLYGAATFSEDIDLWINPSQENMNRFLRTLHASRAQYYKLTPPLELRHLQRGHGFHFTLPAEGQPDIFLDVMGRPPRVDSFQAASTSAKWMDTDWGRILTIGIRQLVELKKTQRLEDYPVISRLALAWVEQKGSGATASDYRWALEHIFTLGELRRLFEEHSTAGSCLPTDAPGALSEFTRQIQNQKEIPDPLETQLTAWMQERLQRLQRADRAYWREIIAELRDLRATGQLMTEGLAV